jgi:hypothetical protein
MFKEIDTSKYEGQFDDEQKLNFLAQEIYPHLLVLTHS